MLGVVLIMAILEQEILSFDGNCKAKYGLSISDV